MVNSISGVMAAADTRLAECWLTTGAFMAGRVDAAHQRPSGALVIAIQGVPGYGCPTAVSGLPQGQPSVQKQYPNKARSAAAIGGVSGPLPPRDPV
jgi:hypothetical protein